MLQRSHISLWLTLVCSICITTVYASSTTYEKEQKQLEEQLEKESRLEEKIKLYREIIQKAIKAGLPLEKAIYLGRLGTLFYHNNQYHDAKNCFSEALKEKELPSKLKAVLHYMLGHIQFILEDYQGAFSQTKTALWHIPENEMHELYTLVLLQLHSLSTALFMSDVHPYEVFIQLLERSVTHIEELHPFIQGCVREHKKIYGGRPIDMNDPQTKLDSHKLLLKGFAEEETLPLEKRYVILLPYIEKVSLAQGLENMLLLLQCTIYYTASEYIEKIVYDIDEQIEQHHYKQAEDLIKEAKRELELLQESPYNMKNISMLYLIYEKWAELSFLEGNRELSDTYSRKILDDLEPPVLKMASLLNLIHFYLLQKRDDKAVEIAYHFINTTYIDDKTTHDTLQVLEVLEDIFLFYERDDAIEPFFKQVIKNHKSHYANDSFGLLGYLNQQGWAYLRQNDTEKALPCFEESLTQESEAIDAYQRTKTYLGLALIYQIQGKKEQKQEYKEKIQAFIKQHSSVLYKLTNEEIKALQSLSISFEE